MPVTSKRRKKPSLKDTKGLYWRGNVIWMARTVNGKTHNVSTGTSDVKVAKQFLADFNLRAFKGEKLGVKSRKKVTFQELANRYLDQGKVDGLRSKSVSRYAAVRDHFQDFLVLQGMTEIDVKDIGPKELEDFKLWRATTPLNRNGSEVKIGKQADASGASPKTLQFELQTLGTFFRYGERLELLEKNPLNRIRRRAGNVQNESSPVYLDEDEIERFLLAAETYDSWVARKSPQPMGKLLHQIFNVYLKTGLRLDELRHLEWTDVDLVGGVIHIRSSKQVLNQRTVPISPEVLTEVCKMGCAAFDALRLDDRKRVLGDRFLTSEELSHLKYEGLAPSASTWKSDVVVEWKPKTKGRTIPISPNLGLFIKCIDRTSNLVFPDPVVGGLWRLKINRLMHRCCEHAGIEKSAHIHSLRHTFATHLRKRGVPLETIKELLGHSDIRETLIYAQFSQEEAEAAIRKIDFF